jgi:hypothetical protein
VLEQFEFPYRSLYDEDIRKGNLGREFDVIIFPDLDDKEIVIGNSKDDYPLEYAGGIGLDGVESIAEFLRNGGTLIALNSAYSFASKYLNVGVGNSLDGLSRTSFYVPGSILRTLNDTTHPIAYGFGRTGNLFFRRSPAFSVFDGHSVVKFPPDVLLSGWINGEDYMVGRSAIVDVPYEKGRVILIGFPVQYRGQAHATFRYLFNSIYYGASRNRGLQNP